MESKMSNEKSKISAEQFKSLIEDFSRVQKEDWLNLQKGEFIRYIQKPGIFRLGGYVKFIWSNEGKNYIQLTSNETNHIQNSDVGVNKEFPVELDSITAIYTKSKNLKTRNDIDTVLKNQSEELVNHEIEIDQMKEKIRLIESELAHMKFILKHHFTIDM